MANVVSQLEIVTKQMTKAVVKLQTASYFEPSVVAEKPLKLSQAYCLMWQERESGDVDGRRSSFELLGGAIAAALLDLIVMGRIELEVAPKSALGFSYKKNYVKVREYSYILKLLSVTGVLNQTLSLTADSDTNQFSFCTVGRFLLSFWLIEWILKMGCKTDCTDRNTLVCNICEKKQQTRLF